MNYYSAAKVDKIRHISKSAEKSFPIAEKQKESVFYSNVIS